MFELYRLVKGVWEYYGTYDLTDPGAVKAYTDAVWQFAANGFPVKTEAET